MKVTHEFINPQLDIPSDQVSKPSDWNKDHVVKSAADGIVFGRRAGEGPGLAEEIPLAIGDDSMDLSGLTGGLTPPSGTTAERPDPPKDGQTRWNTTTGRLEYWDGEEWVTIGDDTFTGALQWSFINAEPSGWIFFQGSIGKFGSPADHARDDCKKLYTLCWGLDVLTFPMTDGNPRGTSANVDWTAGRALTLPDWRERVFAIAGDINGSTPPNILGVGTSSGGFPGPATLYQTAGEKQHAQVTAETGQHSHTLPAAQPPLNLNSGGGTGTGFQVGGSSLWTTPATDLSPPPTIGLNVVQPTVMLNVFVKL